MSDDRLSEAALSAACMQFEAMLAACPLGRNECLFITPDATERTHRDALADMLAAEGLATLARKIRGAVIGTGCILVG